MLTAPATASPHIYIQCDVPEGMTLVEAAYTERSVLPARDIRVTAFGNRVQEAGAGVVSLGGLYADPIGAMRRAQSRHSA